MPFVFDDQTDTSLRPAVRTKDGILIGRQGDHHDDVLKDAPEADRGFVDASGNFIKRQEAGREAKAAGLDVPGNLHSETLNQATGVENKKGRFVFDDEQPSKFSTYMKGQDAKPMPWYDKIGTGIKDVAVAARQLGAHEGGGVNEEVPSDIAAQITATQDERAKQIDLRTQQREKGIQDERKAAGETGPEWWRMTGNMIGTIPLAALNPAVAGAAAGALTPVTEGDFGTKKAKQIGIGTVAGKAGELVAKGADAGIKAFGEYLGRKFPESIENQAVQAIMKRLGQDNKAGGPTATEALEAINETQKPLTLADVGGENVKALAGHVARQPGESRNIMKTFLEGRDKAAGQRLESDIAETFGTGSTKRTAEALEKAQSAAAGPLYDDAYAANQMIEHPALSKILETPAGTKALAKAREKMQNDMTLMGRPYPELTALVKELSERGQMVNPETGIGVARGLKLRTWDYVKRSLDDQINAAFRAGENDDARILVGMKKDLVRTLDSLDATAVRDAEGNIVEPGKYAQARKVFSGVEQTKQALDAGRSFMKDSVSPEDVADMVAKMSPGDREFYKLAVADQMRAKLLQRGGGDETKAIMKSEWVQKKIEALAGSKEDADRFIKAVTDERAMFNTKYDVLGNSATAKRLAEDNSPHAEVMQSGWNTAKSLAGGNWLKAAVDAWKLQRGLGKLNDPALNAKIAEILVNPQLGQSTAGQRLSGTFTGPPTRNYLAPLAGKVGQAGSYIAPEVAAAANSMIGP